MVIGQALVKADNPAGLVYGGVVVPEPWKAEDNTLVFTKISYLELYLFMVVQSLKKNIDVEFDGIT
jgi:hypothetical protein